MFTSYFLEVNFFLYIFARRNKCASCVRLINHKHKDMKRFFLVLLAMSAFSAAFAQLPKVTLKDINGKSVAVDTLGTHGQPVIVDFFATWCKPCRRELNAIAEIYEDWQKEGVRLVAISIDEAQNVQKVKPLVAQEGWEYEVLLDAQGDVKRALGVQSIPFVLVVDGKGNIIYRHTGYTDGAEEEIIETIRKSKKK